MKVYAPGTWKMSHSPGTFECSHCCSPCEQSSQTTDLLPWGCQRLPFLLGFAVLPRMKFLLGQLTCHHHSPWEHTASFATNFDVPCWWIGQSPPLHIPTQFALVVLVLEVLMDRVTALCCLLPEVGWSGTWEISYICLLFLSERRWFSYAFGSQVLGSHAMPADGNSAW